MLALFSLLRTFGTNRPNLAAFGSGALGVLAMPPFGLLPVLLLSLPALYWLLQNASTRQAFTRGFCFALGFHVLGLFWIASAMTVDLASFWWAIPLAVVALPAYFALYTGLSTAVYVLLKNNITEAARPLLLALLLMVAAIAQSRLFTGFEWNLYGQAWHHVLPVMQSLSLFGIHALTFLTLLLALIPVWLRARHIWPPVLLVLLFLALGLWGAARLQQHLTEYVPQVQLRLVQPNIPQELKWDAELRDQHFNTLLQLTDLSAALMPTHIIWPEAATPFMLNRAPDARLEIGLRTPSNGLSLIGTPWREDTPTGRIYYNSMAALDATGTIVARYDKAHLVPFGEYFPMRALLQSLGLNINAIAAGSADFTAGAGPRTLALAGLPPVSPLICYEIIFSGKVTDAERPQWLLNLTNDAWFGSTTGPHQHFAAARLRALEEGLPVVRVANTGITGIVDAYGRVLAATKLNQQVVLDHGLPQAADSPTFFSHYRFGPLLLLLFGSVLLLFAFCNKRR